MEETIELHTIKTARTNFLQEEWPVNKQDKKNHSELIQQDDAL